MAWIYLGLAGILEVVWAIGLKYTEGWTKLWPSVFTLFFMLLGFWCLAQSVKSIPIGTAYAIWVGVGAVGTATAGILLFHEPVTALRIFFLGLIVAGVAGLKFST